MQPLIVKWYCNNRSEGLLHHLHCYTLGNTLSANSKSIQNWKQKLIIWNDVSSAKISKLLNCCFHHSLASLSVLFKHKSLSFVSLSLFLHHILVGTYLYFAHNSETSLEGARCKTGIYSWNLCLMERYAWCMKIHFQFHVFGIWSISAYILSIIAWEATSI